MKKADRTDADFQPQSDNYLKFLVEELKPYIDTNYSVFTKRENTCIEGSSMGGLISWYALCEYPEIFGGTACLSTHWPGTFTLLNNPVPDAFIHYLKKQLPDPATHRIYFVYGDQSLNVLYPEIQKRVDKVLAKVGYTSSNWQTLFFPGDDHSEIAWARRLNRAFSFLWLKE